MRESYKFNLFLNHKTLTANINILLTKHIIKLFNFHYKIVWKNNIKSIKESLKYYNIKTIEKKTFDVKSE